MNGTSKPRWSPWGVCASTEVCVWASFVGLVLGLLLGMLGFRLPL